MAHRLKPKEALAAARTAAVRDWIRVTNSAQIEYADAGWTAEDVEHVIKTATTAEPRNPPERWRLGGGRSLRGDGAVIDVEIRERLVRILRVTKG